MPHVLLVVDGLGGALGGGERIALKMAALLPRYGYRVSILTFGAPDNLEVRTNPPCPIYLLPLTSAFNVSAVRAAFDFRNFLRDQSIQIVQTFFESSDLWAGVVAKLLSPARLIWSRRDMGILRTSKHRIAYRLLAGMPDRVFAVSELVRQHCIEVDHVEPSRVETIYNGLDVSDWSADGSVRKDPDVRLITSVGNIRKVKGHDIFIRASAKVAERFPNAMFSVAGAILDKAYFEQIEGLVRDLGLAGKFHFRGSVTDLRSHFAAADVFVLPSRSEGFSNAIVEAMAMSLPVVATAVGGNAEAVSDGVSGFIVPPEDPEALAAAILRLLDDPGRAREMGQAGRQLVVERFTVDAMMGRVTRAYSDVLGAGASARALDSRVSPPASPQGSASST